MTVYRTSTSGETESPAREPRLRRRAKESAGDRSNSAAGDTQSRVLEAASQLFAERGFANTTIRDIAERANVNVASGHYHFGSKVEIYHKAVTSQFAALDERLSMGGGAYPGPEELKRLSRGEIEDLLRRRIRTLLEFLIGPPPAPHGAIMQREMCDPTEALPMMVRELVLPQRREMRALVSRLAPSLGTEEADHCSFGIVSQVFFYRQMLPILTQLFDLPELPPSFVADAADCAANFALGGIAAAERRARRRRQTRRRKR